MDLSTLAITVVALASLAWLAFLFSTSVSGGAGDEIPPNLRPYKTDAELESRRLDTTLATALTLSAFLAISLPLYYLGENRRQAAAAESFRETSIEEGRHIYEEEFQCVNCHGPNGVGGAATFRDPRSGVQTQWLAPALDDIFYRYDREEVRYWIVYGRANTPMPAWGLEGGGPMNSAQVDAVLDYLESIQISQEDALGQIDQRVQAELNRLETAEQTIQGLIESQQAELERVRQAPEKLEPAQQLLERLRTAVRQGATGLDSDGDGLSDSAEQEINQTMEEIGRVLGTNGEGQAGQEEGQATTTTTAPGATTTAPPEGEGEEEAEPPSAGQLRLSPTDPTSTTTQDGQPIPDLDAVSGVLQDLESEVTTLQVTVDNLDQLTTELEEGIGFLGDSLEDQPWAFDFERLASEGFDGDVEAARRAAALFNAYCARCHTAGYPAGIAFTRSAGSGAWGPALEGGRAVIQFPEFEDHVEFIIEGTENAIGYGVNGIGTGRMPAFGQILSREDLELIASFERGL